jgi:ABC-type phosphate transport system substrate-binding protein
MLRHRMMAALSIVLALTATRAAAAHAQAAGDASGAVAIVVHPATKIDNLTFDELRRIFRGERQFWPDGSRVTLLVRAPVTQERKLVLQKIYRMNEDAFRQYWIAKMFRAEIAAGPKIVYSSEMARELVTAIPGAIGFMPVGSVGAGVKVVRIDGRLPSDPNYSLK